MKQDAEANAESDKKAKEEVDKLNSADQMIFQTETQLKEFGEKIASDKKETIGRLIEGPKKTKKSKGVAGNGGGMGKNKGGREKCL